MGVLEYWKLAVIAGISLALFGGGWESNTIWTRSHEVKEIIATAQSDNQASKDLEEDFARERQKVLSLNKKLEALNAKRIDCRADDNVIRLRNEATGFTPASR